MPTEYGLLVDFRNGAMQDRADFMKALEYISRTPEGRFLRDQLYENILKIEFNSDGKSSYDVANKIMYWDPKRALNVIEADGDLGAISPAVVLAHELYHWYYDMGGDRAFEEEVATAYEGRIASGLGEPVRASHNSFYGPNPDPRTYDSTASATQSGGGGSC